MINAHEHTYTQPVFHQEVVFSNLHLRLYNDINKNGGKERQITQAIINDDVCLETSIDKRKIRLCNIVMHNEKMRREKMRISTILI